MKENKFQSDLKKEIKERFPGCLIIKEDSGAIQGIPDLIILYKHKWATLEAKREKDASKQPNQDYYVDLMNKMSFSRIVYPENKEQVLNELAYFFKEDKNEI